MDVLDALQKSAEEVVEYGVDRLHVEAAQVVLDIVIQARELMKRCDTCEGTGGGVGYNCHVCGGSGEKKTE